eukprot:Opistho-2@95420
MVKLTPPDAPAARLRRPMPEPLSPELVELPPLESPPPKRLPRSTTAGFSGSTPTPCILRLPLSRGTASPGASVLTSPVASASTMLASDAALPDMAVGSASSMLPRLDKMGPALSAVMPASMRTLTMLPIRPTTSPADDASSDDAWPVMPLSAAVFSPMLAALTGALRISFNRSCSDTQFAESTLPHTLALGPHGRNCVPTKPCAHGKTEIVPGSTGSHVTPATTSLGQNTSETGGDKMTTVASAPTLAPVHPLVDCGIASCSAPSWTSRTDATSRRRLIDSSSSISLSGIAKTDTICASSAVVLPALNV